MRRSHQPVRRTAEGGAVNCAVVDHGAVKEGDEAAEGECDAVYHPLVQVVHVVFVEQDAVYCGKRCAMA